MKDCRGFAVCGGDKRQLYAARALAKDGYDVALWGLQDDRMQLPTLPMESLLRQCDCFLLPMPVTVDGTTLFAPESSLPLSLTDGLAVRLAGKRVFAGMASRLAQADVRWKQVEVRDYGTSEQFAIPNGWLTAEGALALAISHSPKTIWKSRCLVTGYGRIGRVLAKLLRDLGAEVWVAVRNPTVFTQIRCDGYHALFLEQLSAETSFDFIFNTIPSPIFTKRLLAHLPIDCTAMELASAPFGFDFAAAERLGVSVIKGSGLPGRFSPQRAGEITKETILTMLKE